VARDSSIAQYVAGRCAREQFQQTPLQHLCQLHGQFQHPPSREDWCIVEIGSAIRPIGVSHLTCRIVTYEANRKYSYMDDGVIAISSDRIGWSRWKEGSRSYCTNWLSERRAAQRCQPECRTLPFVCRYLHQGTAVPNANFIPINRFTWNQNCDLDKPGGVGAYSPRHHPVQFPEMARAHGALT